MRYSARAGRLFALALFVLIASRAAPAEAACTSQSGAGTFGSVDSFSAASTQQQTTSTSGFRCTGGLLAIASTNWVTATLQSASSSSGNQALLLNSAAGDTIPLLICRTVDCSNPISIGGQTQWSSSSLLGLLGLFNASDGSLPLYIRTLAGGPLSAGTYNVNLTFLWEWHLCTAGVLGVCIYENGTSSTTVTLTMIVTPTCRIDALDVDFGTAPFATSFAPVTQGVSIVCTKGSAYNVGIDDGLHFAGGTRRMSGPGGSLAYDIYYPANADSRWGSTGSERVQSANATAGAGSLDGVSAQTFTYQARIVPGPTPSAGVYTDVLILDVQF